MGYILSTEEARQKVGDITLEIISHRENTRTSCIRRVSDNKVVGYSIVTFYDEGIRAFDVELHNQIISGKAIGETIRDSGAVHERITSEPFLSKINFELSFLFGTKKEACLSRTVDYKINGSDYVSITEFYNPDFIAIENNFEEERFTQECLVIDQLKPGFEEDYLRLTHGFLKKSMHVGIEDEDTFVRETRQTLDLLMKDSNSRLFVMANGGQFIGYIAFNIHPALHVNGLECALRELYIKDEYQGKGMGTILMSYVERYARKIGCKRMSLATNWNDPRQKSFYESVGFSRRCDFAVKYIV